MCWGEGKVSTLDIARYGSVDKAIEKILNDKKAKIKIINISCGICDYDCKNCGSDKQ